ARPRRDVGHADGGAHRAVRLPRGLLQRAAAAFGARLSQPAGVRAAARTGSGGNLTQVSTKPGQVQSASQAAKAAGSARPATEPAKTSLPVVKTRWSAAKYFPRNTWARARTGKRKPGGEAIQRAPSAVSAPPVTIQCRCRCRCWERFWPQVWRIAVPPRSPPRWRGSRAKVVSVAAAARKRRL